MNDHASQVRMTAAVATVTALVLSMLVAVSPTLADSSWSPSTQLSPNASVQMTSPRMVASQDGLKIAVVWVRRTGPSSGVVQVARSSDGGLTWNAPQMVTATPQNVENPRIVASNDLSRVRVFWVEKGASYGTIRTSQSVDGSTWPSAMSVTEDLLLGDSEAYDVAGAPDGQAVHVAWTEDVPATGYDVIKWRAFNGTSWIAEEAISPTPGIASRPTLATTNGGNDVTVAWNHVNAPQARTTQLRRRVTGTWSPVRTLSPANSNSSFEAQLVMRSATTGAAIWSQFSNGNRVPFVSVNSGGTWSTGDAIGDSDSHSHQVAAAADGARIVAVWGTSAGVTSRTRFNGTWQPAVVLPGPSGDQLQVAASSAAKQLVAVWVTSTKALAAASSADGGITWTALPSPAGPGVSSPSIAMAGDGKKFAVAWSGQTLTNWFTWAAAGPALVASAAALPNPIDFGKVDVGSVGNAAVTVTNTGLAELSVLGSTVTGQDFGRTFGGCFFVLQPGASCSLPIVFVPTAAGPKSATVTIAHTAGKPLTVQLVGEGVPVVVPSPAQSPTVRQPQVPRDAKGIPPKRIRKEGRTVLVGRNALTNASQPIQTAVRVKAPKSRYRIIKGRKGKVVIRAFGKPLRRVTLIQKAPETSAYLAYERKTVYRKGKSTVRR